MNFEFGVELDAIREWARGFGEQHCKREYIRELDKARVFPEELYQKMAEAGFMSIAAPEQYGGSGGDIMMQAVVCEELARAMQGSTIAWFTTSCFGVQSVGAYGTTEQMERLLPGICNGSIKFSISVTEPDGGTDVLGALKTKAAKVDGGWLVNGNKVFTTGAHVADYILLCTRTGPAEEGKKYKGVSALLVDRHDPGITMEAIETIGMNTIDSFSIHYDDVFVPDSNVLGEPNNGWQVLTHTLNNERILTAALCVGVAQAAFEDALAYAKERRAFGKPIGQFQTISNYLVNMQISIEEARLLTYRAAWLQSNGKPCGPQATMAGLVASECVSRVADDGIQILGGYGYTMEADMQRYWRDTRHLRIGPISNEMSRNYLGTSLGLPKSY